MNLSALLLAALVAAGAGAAGERADPAHHPPASHVSARRCGSAVYACTPLADGAPAPPSTCVNLCVKGADPPRVPLPEGVCGPPCTAPEEACVLAARAAAATVGTGGGGMGADGATADDATAAPSPSPAPPQFEAVFEMVRPGGEACPLMS